MAILQSTSITGSLEVTGSGTLLDLSSTTGNAKISLNAIENQQDSIIELTEVNKSAGGFIKYDSFNFYIGTKETNVYTNHILFDRGGDGITLLQNTLLNTAQTFTVDVDNETTYTPFLLRDENSLYPIFSLANTGNPSNVIQLVSTGSATFVGANNLTGNYALKVTDDSNNSILSVANDGKVGIGTDSPSETLSVNGDASFGSAFIKGSGAVQLHLGYGNSSSAKITTQRTIFNIKGGTASDGSGGSNYFTIQPMRNGGASFTAAGTDLNSDKLTLYYQQFDSDSNYIGAIRRQGSGWFAANDHRMIGIGDSDYSNDSAGTVLWYTNNQTYHKGLLLSKTGNVGINTTSPTERLHVSGNLKIDGLVTGSLTVASSGSTVLDIQGSQGQLFSVVDSFSGSLFKVATISGAPVIEVFSDNTVNIGAFNNEAIVVSGSHTTLKNTVVSGSVVVDGSQRSNYSTMSFVYSGSNLTQVTSSFTSTQQITNLNYTGSLVESVEITGSDGVNKLYSITYDGNGNVSQITVS